MTGPDLRCTLDDVGVACISVASSRLASVLAAFAAHKPEVIEGSLIKRA